MAAQFEGGVVVGADSRTTTGSYIVRPSDIRSRKPSAHSFIRSFKKTKQKGQPRDRQTDLRPRPHLLLSIRLGGGYASHRGCGPHGAAASYVRGGALFSPLPHFLLPLLPLRSCIFIRFSFSNFTVDADKRAVDHHLCMSPRRCSKLYAIRTRTR